MVLPGEPTGGFVLPVGTVTLLLSDFEGSVRAWQSDPDAMALVTSRLDDLVGDVVGRHGGVRPLEQGEGDSFVAAFSRATEAVAAAVEIQVATTQSSWPGGLPVRLRMALHTGEAQLRDQANYMGAAINRCARLRALAHGGQVLLSGATHDLVLDHHLLPGVDFEDLGTHRLRDLARPEHVYQLRHPELTADFPPLRGLDVVPNNLPTQLTTFIGRTAELADIARLVGGHRLVTLTGSGGCGKTRLAVQAAAELSVLFPDGVWFVDLAPVTGVEGLGSAVAAALGIRVAPGQDPLAAIVARSQSSTLLVLLDNCEHLIEGCGELVKRLLSACPTVRVLATSREILAVEGEVTWRVPSLAVPPADSNGQLDALGTCEAVRLFVDRALQARPNFTVTNETAGAVAAICRRLDGIPLPIELAAARVRLLSPAQIAAGLDDRFRLLGGGARTALPRQQTLTASVAWSHDLLTEEERVVFRRLSVFAAGFDLDAAEAVAGADGVDPWTVLDVVAALVDKSLVGTEDRGAATRYRLLETLRAFAADRLAEAGETDGAFERAARHYLARAEAMGDSAPGLLVSEMDTIRPLVGWTLTAAPALGLRLAAVLSMAAVRVNDVATARRWLETALARDPGDDPLARARALAELAYVCFPMMDLAPIPGVAAEAIEIGRQLGDDRSVARALNARGWALGTVFGPEHGLADLDEAIGLARRCGDSWCLIDALKNRGYITVAYGHPSAARPLLEEAVATARQAGDTVKENEAGLWLVWVDLWTGNLERAALRAEQIAAEFDAREVWFFASVAHGYIGHTQAYLGHTERASLAFARAQELARSLSDANPWLEGSAMLSGCLVQFAIGDLETSRALGERAAEICGPGSPVNMRLPILATLTATLIELGDVAAARRCNTEVLEAAQHNSMAWHLAAGKLGAARIAVLEGDRARAEDLAHEALSRALDVDDAVQICQCLELLARLAADAQSHAESARLLGAALGLRDRIAYVAAAPDAAQLHRLRADLEAVLGADQLVQLIGDGAALDPDAAITYARRGRGDRKRPSAGWSSLTPTELEVVRLVARGLTNPQVAEQLFVTRATVKAHLGHIFPKLGVASRAELAAVATRQGLRDAQQ